MPRHPDSISRRLTWMNMLVSGCALLIAGVTFAAYDFLTFRDAMVQSLSTEADIVATNSKSALLFNDPGAAEQTLAGLQASPGIVLAQIYASDGRLFASYSRDRAGQPGPPPQIPPDLPEIASFDASSVDVARRVVSEGAPIGVVRIRSNLQAMYQRLRRFALIVTVVLLVSLVGAMLVSGVSQRAISRPLTAVAEV